MTELAVVDGPSFEGVAEGLLYSVGYLFQVNIQSADSNLNQVALVYEQLEVVPSTSFKHFSAECRLEATSLSHLTCEIFIVKYEFAARFLRVPRKECFITMCLRLLKPSGTSTMMSLTLMLILSTFVQNVIGALVGKHYTPIYNS